MSESDDGGTESIRACSRRVSKKESARSGGDDRTRAGKFRFFFLS